MSLKMFRVIFLSLIFHVRRIRYFKENFLYIFLSKALFLATNIIFWISLKEIGYKNQEWKFSHFLVFVAYSELFFGFERSLFYSASRFWRLVYSGNLDNFLMRPFDVRLRFIILNIDFTEFIFTILEFIIIVSFVPVNFLEPMVILGVLIVFLSNIILALIRLTLSYLAFLLGKVDAISELADSLNLFNKYPLENINIVLSMLFRTILPFYFFSTLPSRIVNKMMTAGEIRVSLVALSISIIIWVLIHNSVWEWGLRKYENTGG